MLRTHESALTVFVSYAPGDAAAVRHIAKLLSSEAKLNIWLIDKERLQDNLDEKIQEGVTICDVVAIFYSNTYLRENSSRDEAEYIHKQRKLMLPVCLQPGLKLDGTWLDWLLHHRHTVDFQKGSSLRDVAAEVVEHLFQVWDDASSARKFHAFGVERETFPGKLYRHTPDFNKLEAALTNLCRSDADEEQFYITMPVSNSEHDDARTLVVTGDEGVGKSFFIARSLLDPSETWAGQCGVRLVLWLDCSAWKEEEKFDRVAEEAFAAELTTLVALATRRGLTLWNRKQDLAEHLRLLKENIGVARPLFIFDDVRHFRLIQIARKLCRSSPMIVISRTEHVSAMRNTLPRKRDDDDEVTAQTPWDGQVQDVINLDRLSDDAIYNLIRDHANDLENDDIILTADEMRNMAVTCEGLPRKAVDMFNGYYDTKKEPAIVPNIISSRKIISATVHAFAKRIAEGFETHKSRPELQSQPNVKFVGVPSFGNYFPRPKEEEAIRKGVRCLCRNENNEKGYFVIQGQAGIGKSTVVSHVLRDPQNADFFQRHCGINIVIWLNCYQWRDGLPKEDGLVNKLLALAAEADPTLLREGRTKPSSLNQMLEHFARKDSPEQILFVLDDVLHHQVLETFSSRCESALCCVITRKASSLKQGNIDLFRKMFVRSETLPNPLKIPYLSNDHIFQILQDHSKLKGKLSEKQIRDLSNRTYGLPVIVNLLGSYFRNRATSKTYDELVKKINHSNLSGDLSRKQRAQTFASHLFGKIFETLSIDDQQRYFTFLLFNPSAKVDRNCLERIWNAEKDGRNICDEFERFSLVQRNGEDRRSAFYSVPQTFHESAARIAFRTYAKEGVRDLSQLRVRLLRDGQFQSGCGSIPKMLSSMNRQGSNDLAEILGLIDAKCFIMQLLTNEKVAIETDLDTVLLVATATNHLHLVKYLLDNGVNVNAADKDGKTALLTATEMGYSKIVDALLAKGADASQGLLGASLGGRVEFLKLFVQKEVDLEVVGEDGRTALMTAAQRGHKEVVHLLLKNGAKVNPGLLGASSGGQTELVKIFLRTGDADIDVVDKDGHTSLMLAASGGHEEVVQTLLENWANVNAIGPSGQTALHIAVMIGNHKIVQMLIDKRAKTGEKYDGKTCLMLAAEQGYENIVAILLEKGQVDVNAVHERSGKTALMLAVSNGHEKVVETLLEKGSPDMNVVDNYGERALMTAVRDGKYKITEMLLEKAANVSQVDVNGNTILMLATDHGHDKIAGLLLEKGADIGAVDNNGKTVLWRAACLGHEKIVKRLLVKGADVNQGLLGAALGGQSSTVKLCLKKGADIEVADESGWTALLSAVGKQHGEIVKMLLEMGANANTVTECETTQTALMLAAKIGSERLVRLLLRKGANVDQLNKNGQTAAMIAMSEGKDKIVEILQSDLKT